MTTPQPLTPEEEQEIRKIYSNEIMLDRDETYFTYGDARRLLATLDKERETVRMLSGDKQYLQKQEAELRQLLSTERTAREKAEQASMQRMIDLDVVCEERDSLKQHLEEAHQTIRDLEIM